MNFRFVVFVSILAVVVTGIMNLVAWIANIYFPVKVYPVMLLIVWGCCFISWFIISPLANLILKDEESESKWHCSDPESQPTACEYWGSCLKCPKYKNKA